MLSFKKVNHVHKQRNFIKFYTTQKQIKKLMCANRGEIAIRVFRAATELGIKTVSIFTQEDRLHIHRMKSDESYMVGGGSNKTPVGAYLDIEEIIKIAKENNVDAIHPGYGFLSENAHFAEACEKAGIIFVGPSVEVLKSLGDKTKAKLISKNAKVPCIPGSAGAIQSFEDAKKQVEEMGLPVMIKASMGGGGRGMRVVKEMSELKDSYESASSEAKSFFGDGSVFIEKFIEKPRHIEVQVLGDNEGNIIHLFERDCSIQRRHQKVVEIAPAFNLDEKTRENITNDAVKIAKYVGYKNAGTVEFLLDQSGNHYFIEVNPRIQVEHTVTEEVTGIDLVQSQIKVASGMNFKEMGLKQDEIQLQGYAIQCRVTTEDPQKDFQPDHGKLEVFRSPEGFGIRLDSTAGIYGIVITPHYDSLLSKVTARGKTYEDAIRKLSRALSEFRIRGVKTNVPFVSRILSHPDFIAGNLHTGFIAENPQLFKFRQASNRAHKLLGYFATTKVNGISVAGADVKVVPPDVKPTLPELMPVQDGWRKIFLEKGPKEFAKAVRSHDKALLMDTTLRDAHQSLLATRMRTYDMLKIAPYKAGTLHKLYSLECWGGATFDVALRFLKECPWDRLRKLREAIPNIPFQMLLRGANAVGYTSYPDNVVYKFVKEAKDNGVDIFRVFDSLNYVENLKLGIDAVGEAGGIIETSICYTGNVLNPKKNKYNIDYYMKLVDEVVKLGTHVLNIKDMAGLLTPECATFLVSSIRKEYPDLPIHVHTHDTAGTGVASMIAAVKAGADIVDVATDAMCGLTSQPSMGAIVASLKETQYDTGIDLNSIQGLNDYWEQIRELYGPFESGQKSAGADVFLNEMPGGQYTNLLFQSKSLGLSDQWPKVKQSFSDANELLGDIVKVTPSSKVVGDLAQFMVTNKLTPEMVKQEAKNLDFPSSVVDYFQGYLGIPHGGFPEPLRTDIIKDAERISGRPGASLPPMDLDKLKEDLIKKYSEDISDVDVMSAAMYPKVFDEYMEHKEKYGDVSVLTTKQFIAPLEFGEEVEVVLEKGKIVYVKLTSVGALDKKTGKREVFFDLNGIPRSILVDDNEAQKSVVKRPRADPSDSNSVGAPMPGSIIEIKVKNGEQVEKGQPIIVLSAMKMETIVRSTATGKVSQLDLKVGDELKAGDLLIKIE